MDPESDTRWERIEEIFARAHGLDHASRAALLDDACAGDAELRAQVEQLLHNYQSALNLFAQFPDLLVKVSNIRSATRTFADGELVSERFRIVRLMGQGGMGEVYEAEDLLLRHESVALKTVRASLAADAAAVKRLTNELWLARHIADPHVCRVFDVYQHTQAGAPVVFFTMELLRGDTLADRIRTGTMPTRDALSMLKQMAAAIDAAHLAHVAHGDFKPANVMIVASDAGDRLVVTDFGLARWLPLGSALLTIPDSRQWGTPAYMAPEQFFGGKVTPATDIYALGVVLYEIVTGHRPFESAPGDVESPLELALRKLRRAPRSPREYVKDLDPRWETAILRCLDANPGKRFALASDIVKALEQPPGNARWWMAGAAALACAAAIGIPPVRSAVVEMSSPISTAVARYFGSERTIAILPFSHENQTAEGDAVSIGLSAAVTDRLATLSDGWRGIL